MTEHYNDKYLSIVNFKDKFVVLKLYLDNVGEGIAEKYRDAVEKQQNAVVSYINRYYMNNVKLVASPLELEQDIYIDAGFDVFVPNCYHIDYGKTVKINMKVKTAMYYNGIPCSFYMYPRSSTGSKTPLRLANSVGVIDSGYRGNLIAVFDNIKDPKQEINYRHVESENSKETSASLYKVDIGDRLVQICSGNLLYPIFPIIVDSVEQLGYTSRGSGGFGSTGK